MAGREEKVVPRGVHYRCAVGRCRFFTWVLLSEGGPVWTLPYDLPEPIQDDRVNSQLFSDFDQSDSDRSYPIQNLNNRLFRYLDPLHHVQEESKIVAESLHMITTSIGSRRRFLHHRSCCGY